MRATTVNFPPSPISHLPSPISLPSPIGQLLSDGRILSAEEEAYWFRQMRLLQRQAGELCESAKAAANPVVRLECELRAESFRREAIEIRNGLACVFMRLAIGLARRFVTGQFTLDELVSEANLTLLSAIANFDANLGFRFSTYATRAIRRNLYRFVIKRRTQDRRETPTDALAEAPDHRDPEPLVFEKPSAAALNAIVNQLRERDAYIVRRRFGLFYESPPFTLQRVADELGVTRERVRQLENRALRQLRTLAEEQFAGSLEA